MRIEFSVPGEPIAQPRARATAAGPHARLYTPSGNGIQEFKALVRLVASQHCTSDFPFDGPVRVDCFFTFSRPRSHFRTGKHSCALRPDAPTWHINKPDRDNLDKAILDALKGIAFTDDCRVYGGMIFKRYADYGEQASARIVIER